jgi:uncharacterized protein
MILELFGRVALDVWQTLVATWPFLLASVVTAAALEVYVGTARLAAWLRRRTPVAVLGSVALAAATPFCSCGTTAVTLGMIASSAPWAPIVAFMVASPLTSPSELVLSGGLLGWPFALVFFVGTIVLGVAAGGVTAVVERTGWLRDQARFAAPTFAAQGSTGAGAAELPPAPPAAGAPAAPVPASAPAAVASASPTRSGPVAVARLSVGPGAAAVCEVGTWRQRTRIGEFGRRLVGVGRRLAAFFLGFTALGYLMIEAVPTAWLQAWLGGDGLLAVVAAAVLGIPAYVNTEGSLPLLAGLMEGGMGPGPAMAFLVTGAGTSVGAISGLLVIARRRVVALTVAILFAGSLVLGAFTQLLLG